MNETPSEAIFNEIKEVAIKIWSTYDNQFGYVDEKVNRINSIRNYEDNVMVCYRMFDSSNQSKMRNVLSDEALEYINLNN
jgi:hypothetical protein